MNSLPALKNVVLSSCLTMRVLSLKNLVRILINSLIGLILILIWLKLVNLQEVLDKISQVNLLFTIPFIILFALSFNLRAIRLKILLSSEQSIPLSNIVYLTSLSQLLSFLIPLRLGELAKAVYLGAEYKIKFSKALIWILLDRFIDFWTVLIISLVLLIFLPTNLPENLKLSLSFLIVLSSLGGIFLIFFPKYSKKLAEIFALLLVFKPVKSLFLKVSFHIIDTASFLNRGLVGSIKLILITILVLISDALAWWVLFVIVFKTQAGLLPVLLGSLLNTLTYLIPAAPGYIGSAEAAGLAVFHFGLGFDKTLVSAITVLNHALTVFCVLFYGLISLYLLKFDLSLVWKKLKR
ncbi:flippase-like domain-containing protein [Candidatus Daviesbacteria bacterium]|nr:flippase-like domain-containing protein [Candidatus Daviesbacteria bacterium]